MRIQRYFAKDILLAFAVSFLLCFLLFFLNQILLLAEKILSKKAPLEQVLILVVASLPSILALTAPFASFLGILLAVGRSAGDKEILAVQASGIPHRKLMVPVVLLGLVFTAGSWVANDILLPRGAIVFNRVYRELALSTPELELGSYSVKFYKDFFLVTGAVQGRHVQGISLLDKTSQDNYQLITARSAELVDDPKLPGILTLRFRDVLGIVADARKLGTFDYYRADQLDYHVVLKDLIPSSPSLGPKEMQAVDLARQIHLKDASVRQAVNDLKLEIQKQRSEVVRWFWFRGTDLDQGLETAWDSVERVRDLSSRDLTDRVLSTWKTEYYQKFSIPLACLCFVFLAYPLGVILYRSGLTGIIGVGLVAAVGYWALLLVARSLALEWQWPAELALFLPNFVILTASVPLLWRLRR